MQSTEKRSIATIFSEIKTLFASKTVWLMSLWGMCLTLGYAMIRPAIETLFNKTYGPELQPIAWLVVALFLAVIVPLYGYFSRRVSLLLLFRYATYVSLLLFILLLLGRSIPLLSRPMIFCLYVWKDSYIIVFIEIFWTFASLHSRFSAARWSYGFFLLTGTLVQFIGHSSIGILAEKMGGSEKTLWLIIPIFVLGWLFSLLLQKTTKETELVVQKENTQPLKERLKGLHQNSYIFYLLLLVGVTQIVINLIDLQYNSVLNEATKYQSDAMQTRLKGNLFAATDVISFFLNVITGPVLKFLGVGVPLLGSPLLVFGSVLFSMFRPGLLSIGISRTIAKALDYSIFKSSREMLYLPLSYTEKVQGKAFIDMFIYRFGKTFAALLIFPILTLGQKWVIPFLSLGLIAGWVIITVALLHRYRQKIKPTIDAPLDQEINHLQKKLVMEQKENLHSRPPSILKKETCMTHLPSIESLEIIARRIRKYSMIATTKAGSGHPTSSLSIADIMSALFFTQMRYDFDDPKRLDNDRFILSKGHAAPALYATWAAAGVVSPEQIETLRELGSDFEGHPTSRLPWIDVATGSLGQGLANGVGMAMYLKNLVVTDARVWVLLGDGELSEGSIWEVLPIAVDHQLDRLTAIVDVNRLEQSIPTRHGWDLDAYAKQFLAFGWEVIKINGHDMNECVAALDQATKVVGKPTVILAQTQKGHGVSFLADQENWHGKALSQAQLDAALTELGPDDKSVQLRVARPMGPSRRPVHVEQGMGQKATVDFPMGSLMATRKAFGEALKRIGDYDPNVIVFDGDVKNSTFTDIFEKAHPHRFVQSYIAEQSMVGMASGAGSIGALPWVSTFAAFFTRAFDQIRMAALSQSNVKICGTHAGCSIGEDGASQMGLEDLAMFRAIVDSTIVYPSDPYSTEALMHELNKIHGVGYLRATRANTKVIYSKNDNFPIGGSKILRQSPNDRCLIVAAGITLHEALVAYEILQKLGIFVRVLDAYSVKPIDQVGLKAAARACGAKVVVVEDHFIQGGLGDAVLEVFAESGTTKIKKIAVTELPHSGKPEELLEKYGLSGSRIAMTVRSFLAT